MEGYQRLCGLCLTPACELRPQPDSNLGRYKQGPTLPIPNSPQLPDNSPIEHESPIPLQGQGQCPSFTLSTVLTGTFPEPLVSTSQSHLGDLTSSVFSTPPDPWHSRYWRSCSERLSCGEKAGQMTPTPATGSLAVS